MKIGSSDPIVLSFDEINPGGSSNSESYKAGYLYYDAIKLSAESDIGLRKKILDSYGINKSNYTNNPYIKEIFKSVKRLILLLIRILKFENINFFFQFKFLIKCRADNYYRRIIF